MYQGEITTNVRNKIYSVLRDIACDQSLDINDNLDLTNDLKVDSDDLSFIFAPQLEKEFNIKISLKDWKKVNTVGDSIAMVLEYIGRKNK